VGKISCSEEAEFRSQIPADHSRNGSQKQLPLTETSSGFTRCAHDPRLALDQADSILTLQVFQPLLSSLLEENYDLAPMNLTESTDGLFLAVFCFVLVWFGFFFCKKYGLLNLLVPVCLQELRKSNLGEFLRTLNAAGISKKVIA